MYGAVARAEGPRDVVRSAELLVQHACPCQLAHGSEAQLSNQTSIAKVFHSVTDDLEFQSQDIGTSKSSF